MRAVPHFLVCLLVWAPLLFADDTKSQPKPNDSKCTAAWVDVELAGEKREPSIFERLIPGTEQQQTARAALLASEELIRQADGGMATTFVVRDKQDGKLYRYKGPRRDFDKPEHDKAAIERFQREVAFAQRAGEAGVGPKSSLDAATGLLKMEEVEGLNLEEFSDDVLSKMKPADRDAWLENFAVALSEHLETLHRLGIAHLDIKPRNIMIPTENAQGKRIVLIDFGLSTDVDTLDAVREDARTHNHGSHGGTPLFQGKQSIQGNPGRSDDYESLRLTLENQVAHLTGVHKPLHEMPFFKERKRLRVVCAVFGEPEFDHGQPVVHDAEVPGPAQLLRMSLAKQLSADEEAKFKKGLQAEFDKRTPGQKLRILFSDPALREHGALIATLTPDEMRKLIDEGMQENGWRFDDKEAAGVRRPPVADGSDSGFMGREAQERRDRVRIQFKELVDYRKTLGPLPKELLVQPAPHMAPHTNPY